MEKITGLVIAAYTPMREDETINFDKIGELVEYAVNHRMAGLFVNGSTGEFASLTLEERIRTADAYIAAAAGRIPIIVNVASTCRRDSLRLAERAAASGADAICAMAPYYFPPSSPRALADFISGIIPGCGGKPLFLYYAGNIAGGTISVYEFLRIMVEEQPGFAGVKFTSDNLCEYRRCLALSDRLQILYGRDEMLLGALAMGAVAAIGTTFNYLPRVYHGIVDAFGRNDFDEARRLTDITHRAVSVASHYGMPALKGFMKLAGIDVGPWRSPLDRFSVDAEKRFVAEVEAAGLREYLG